MLSSTWRAKGERSYLRSETLRLTMKRAEQMLDVRLRFSLRCDSRRKASRSYKLQYMASKASEVAKPLGLTTKWAEQMLNVRLRFSLRCDSRRKASRSYKLQYMASKASEVAKPLRLTMKCAEQM